MTPAPPEPTPPWRAWILPATIGLALIFDLALVQSATYDEVAYLRVACRWWRTGDQESITRMGSPLLFWKIQQIPVLWAIDRAGLGEWIDQPETHQAALLPLLRISSAWIWLLALFATAAWSNDLAGPAAARFAAWIFALEPTILAHSSLITMEAPILAASAWLCLAWSRFLGSHSRIDWFLAAIAAGIAFACKFSAILWPPVLGAAWLLASLRHDRSPRAFLRKSLKIACAMLAFLLVMALVDAALTGFAMLRPSESSGFHPSLTAFPHPLKSFLARVYESPWPQDWVGFAIQMRHQRSGGPSYLLGTRSEQGWWYYYPIALLVKLTPAFLLMIAARAGYAWLHARRWRSRGLTTSPTDPIPRSRYWFPILVILCWLIVCIAASKRNYGVRYLLPIAPAAVVTIASLITHSQLTRRLALALLAFQTLSLALTHPRELAYFNCLAGGTTGGRHILADSNLDWGQGLKDLAKLQREQPRFQDLTLYYFGDTRPEYYGIHGPCHVIDAAAHHPSLPPAFNPSTRYVAVSASLQFGPWGPPGYFDPLRNSLPVHLIQNGVIAIYEMPHPADLSTHR
jgi:hypothetical protein